MEKRSPKDQDCSDCTIFMRSGEGFSDILPVAQVRKFRATFFPILTTPRLTINFARHYSAANVRTQNIALQLRRVRENKGLTQKLVAERLGLRDSRQVRNLESPKSNPTLDSLTAYATAVGARIIWEVQQMRTLTFINHVGGASKSSVTRDIGSVLGQLGFKILLIDIDPQAHLSEFLGVEEVDLAQTAYSALFDATRPHQAPEGHLPEPIHLDSFDLIPSTIELADLEIYLLSAVSGSKRLRKAISNLAGYDFVLIDPPPAIGQLSGQALSAATDLFVPMPTTLKGVKGLNSILRRIDQYREENPGLVIRGFIPTQFDARSAHQTSAFRYIQEELPQIAPVLSTLRNRPGPYGHAMSLGVPVPQAAPKDPATEELRQVAQDLLSIMDVRAGVIEHG